eukprot:2024392-Rhodomonas_salina.1
MPLLVYTSTASHSASLMAAAGCTAPVFFSGRDEERFGKCLCSKQRSREAGRQEKMRMHD